MTAPLYRCAACPGSHSNTTTGTPDPPTLAAGGEDHADLLAAGWFYLPIDGSTPGEYWRLPGVVTVDSARAARAVQALRLKADAAQQLADGLEQQLDDHRTTVAELEAIVGACPEHGTQCRIGLVERVKAQADELAKLRAAVEALAAKRDEQAAILQHLQNNGVKLDAAAGIREAADDTWDLIGGRPQKGGE